MSGADDDLRTQMAAELSEALEPLTFVRLDALEAGPVTESIQKWMNDTMLELPPVPIPVYYEGELIGSATYVGMEPAPMTEEELARGELSFSISCRLHPLEQS